MKMYYKMSYKVISYNYCSDIDVLSLLLALNMCLLRAEFY